MNLRMPPIAIACLHTMTTTEKSLQYVHSEAMAGRGVVISITDCYRRTQYGEPIVALKSFILSPFVDEADVEMVVSKVLEARGKVGGSC